MKQPSIWIMFDHLSGQNWITLSKSVDQNKFDRTHFFGYVVSDLEITEK